MYSMEVKDENYYKLIWEKNDEEQRLIKVEREKQRLIQLEKEREKEERQLPIDLRRIEEFKHTEKPVPTKVVTILIRMHGYNLEDFLEDVLPEAPTHTIVGGTRVGLCKQTDPGTLDYLRKLRHIYNENKMSVANNLYKGVFFNETDIERNRPLLSKFFKGTPAELEEEYKNAEDENRMYLTDRGFFLMREINNIFDGIFLVHTTDPTLEPLLLPTTSIELNNRYKSRIAPLLLEQANQLQKQNLLNVDVATKVGVGMHEDITTVFTGIPQYKTVRLSDILNYFGRLGVEHVNVIDEACRVYDRPKPYEYMRRLSFKEKEPYPAFIERTGLGGTRKSISRKSRKRKSKRKTRRLGGTLTQIEEGDILEHMKEIFSEPSMIGQSGTSMVFKGAYSKMFKGWIVMKVQYLGPASYVMKGKMFAISKEKWKQEIDTQIDADTKLLAKYRKSFIPSIVFSMIGNLNTFPLSSVEVDGEFGFTFMETYPDAKSFADITGVLGNIHGEPHELLTSLIPLALKEEEMLRSVGYQQMDSSYGNFLVSNGEVYMIDFGRVVPI